MRAWLCVIVWPKPLTAPSNSIYRGTEGLDSVAHIVRSLQKLKSGAADERASPRFRPANDTRVRP